MSQLRNFRIVFSSVLLSWGLAIFIRFLMPRTLGPQILGDYGVAEAWAAMLGTVAAWGFATWISVHFASQKKHEARDATAIIHAQIFLGFLSFSVAMVCAILFHYSNTVLVFLATLAISAVATQIAEAASRMNEAAGHFDRVARIANPIRIVFGGTSAISLALAFFGIIHPVVAAASVAISTTLGEILRATLTLKAAEISIFQAPQFSRAGSIAKDSIMLFVVGATPIVFARVPQIILSRVPAAQSLLPNTASEIGMLTASLSLTIPLGVLVLGIQRVLVPAFSRAKEQGAEAFSKAFSDGTILVMAIVGLAASGLIICDNSVVELLFGERFLAARGVLRITLLTVVVQYASLLLVASAVAWRKERIAAIGAFVAFPVNVILLLLFLRHGVFPTGAESVAWSSLIYEVLIVVVVWMRMKNIFKIGRGPIFSFVFALILATISMVISRFTMGLTLEKQIAVVAATGIISLAATAGVFGKSILKIAKSWK